MVSQLGAPQLSAVSLGTTALSSCTLLFNFLLFLTVPEIASAVVKGDSEEVRRGRGRGVLRPGLGLDTPVQCLHTKGGLSLLGLLVGAGMAFWHGGLRGRGCV